MAINRKKVGETVSYKGHKITVRYLGPDLLCYVGETELPNFYTGAEAARKAGMRHIDHIEKEKLHATA